MSVQELIAAGIPLSDGDPMAALYADAALDWMQEHTTFRFDKADAASVAELPACAKLFCVKFGEVMQHRAGVASQSIEGLSMSFDAGASADMLIWTLARSLLHGHLKSQVRAFPARRRWDV